MRGEKRPRKTRVRERAGRGVIGRPGSGTAADCAPRVSGNHVHLMVIVALVTADRVAGMIAASRAATRTKNAGETGCVTVFDIAAIRLSIVLSQRWLPRTA